MVLEHGKRFVGDVSCARERCSLFSWPGFLVRVVEEDVEALSVDSRMALVLLCWLWFFSAGCGVFCSFGLVRMKSVRGAAAFYGRSCVQLFCWCSGGVLLVFLAVAVLGLKGWACVVRGAC